MYSKSEFCRRAGISQETLRHYVNIGLLHPKEIAENGYRKYSQENILELWFYRLGASLGNSLKEVKDWTKAMTLQNFYDRLCMREQELEEEIRRLQDQKTMIQEIRFYTEHELKTNQAVSLEQGLAGYRAFCDGGRQSEQWISRLAEKFPMVSIEIDYQVPEDCDDDGPPLLSRLGLCIMEEQLEGLGLLRQDLKGMEKMPAMDSLCMSLVTQNPLTLTARDFRPLILAAREQGYRIKSEIICSLFCRETVGGQTHDLLKCRILVEKE